jgi:uncharacterized membrane protein
MGAFQATIADPRSLSENQEGLLVVIVPFFFVVGFVVVVPVLFVILFFVEVVILLVLLFVVDRSQIKFDRIQRDHLEIDAAFRTRYDFPDVLKLLWDFCIAFRTITHDWPPTKLFR